MKALLGLSSAAIVGLTFVWPFAVSREPEQPAFKIAAVATLLVFLASILWLLASRVRRSSS